MIKVSGKTIKMIFSVSKAASNQLEMNKERLDFGKWFENISEANSRK